MYPPWHDGGVSNFTGELVLFLFFQVNGSYSVANELARMTSRSSTKADPVH